jgi:shikimate kinase
MHDRLKRAPGIYLTGFMGCGKSEVGRLLAGEIGWDFVDLDEEIARAAGMPIAEIFSQHGEPAFRALERAAILEQTGEARRGRARVVALGGGAFADERNREALALGGLTIWLDVPLAQLWERVSENDGRPLAGNRRDFETLFEKRRCVYAKADYTVSNAGEGPWAGVDQIRQLGLL